MTSKNTTVFGIYKDRAQAENAVDHVVEFRTVTGGFTHDDISVLLTDVKSTKEFAHENNTKSPEEIAAGARTGGVIDGTLGLLTGFGALAIPGFGPALAAGPIMSGGLGVGGATGGLAGVFAGMGIPEREAKRCESRVRDDQGVFLSVHCETSDQIARAEELLQQTGAEDISSTWRSRSKVITQ
ncbi:MAG: DUF3341 domain-containing protein [Bryobacteraceae bacterium]